MVAPIPNITGGAAGPSGTGGFFSEGISGIDSPIVIGGYKSDGTSGGSVMPGWMFLVVVAVAGIALYRSFR